MNHIGGWAKIAHLEMNAKPGLKIKLDASGSCDIDNNDLSYEWRLYPEAGTYSGEVKIENPHKKTTSFIVPQNASGKTLHILLVVTDNGVPALTRYKRLVIYCK